jgi:hypothetical protein
MAQTSGCLFTGFDDGNLSILRQQTSASDKPWDLVSFRQLSEDR